MKAASPLGPALAAVQACIDRAADGGPRPAMPEPPAGSPLAELRARFGLSAFELAVITCGAAVELAPGFGRACAAALGDPARQAPTIALCIARLPGARWEAFAPDRPLRRFRLIRLGDGDVLTGRALTLPEPVLHFLVGARARDERLDARLREVARGRPLPPSRRTVAALLDQALRDADPPHVQLVAASPAEARLLFADVAAGQGRSLWELPAWALPDAPEERAELMWACARDARLFGGLLLLDLCAADQAHLRAATELASRAPDPIVVCGPEVVRPEGRRAAPGARDRCSRRVTAWAAPG